MPRSMMDNMSLVLRRGVVDGPVLYGTQKLVAYSDIMASNMFGTKLPQELRTPLVGLALGTLPLMLSDHWLAEKISEYSMANAVAQTIALAGNNGSGAPGPIDQAVNKVFAPIANVGAMHGMARGGFPQSALRGYIAPSQGMSGYITGGGSNPKRMARLRGMTTHF